MDQLYDTEPGQPRVPLRATPEGYLIVQIAGGSGGGGSSVTNLTTTVSPTNVVVASDTGTDATIPLADVTNAGAMPPAAVTQLAGLGTASEADVEDFAPAGHTHALLMTTDERTKLGALPAAADLTTSLDGKMANTLPAMQTAFNAGTAPEKAAFRASVSGYAGGATAIGIGNSIMWCNGSWGIIEMICRTPGVGLSVLSNAARGGETTRPWPATNAVGMTARFDAEVAAFKPDIVFALEGRNSVSVGFTDDMICADMLEMGTKTRGWGGKFVIIANPTDTAYANRLSGLNKKYAKLCAVNGFGYFDPWQDSANPTTGAYKDATYSIDNVHPTPMASRLASLRGVPVVRALSRTRLTLPTFNNDTSNLISNGLFLNVTSGRPTGTGQYTGTHTHTITAGTGDVLGNWWDISKTASTDTSSLDLPLSWTGITANTRLYFCCRIRTSRIEANGVSTAPPANGESKVQVLLQLNYWSGSHEKIMKALPCDGEFEIGHYFEVPANYGGGGQLVIYLNGRSGFSMTGSMGLAQVGMYKLPSTF